MNHLKRFAGFALVPLLSFASSLLLLPLISIEFGADGVSALTVGQSIGGFISVFVGLTWPMVGGQHVAMATETEVRQAIFVRSYATRGLVLAICVIPTGLASALLVPEYHLEAAMFAIATACNGLTSAWYFAGTGEPIPVILYEGLTRLAAYSIALLGITFGLGIWVYGAVMLAWGPAMVWFNWMHVIGSVRWSLFPPFRVTAGLVRMQALGTVSRLAQAGFGFGGPPIYAAVSPLALAGFSAADQIQKTATNGAYSVINTFVSWVGTPGHGCRRSCIAVIVCVVGAVAFCVFWLLVGSWVIEVVFAGTIRLTPLAISLLGLAIVATFLARSFELLVMVPRGLEHAVYKSNTILSVVGILGMVLAAGPLGVSGGLIVVSVCSLALVVIYAARMLFGDPLYNAAVLDQRLPRT